MKIEIPQAFDCHMEEQEGAGTTHATETIGWIAIDNGGSVGNGLLVGDNKQLCNS